MEALLQLGFENPNKQLIIESVSGNSTPKSLPLTLHRHLVQMPPPLGKAARLRHPLVSDLGGEHRAKPVLPEPDRLVADVDPALGQKILDVA
jgi:hypothetical protein